MSGGHRHSAGTRPTERRSVFLLMRRRDCFARCRWAAAAAATALFPLRVARPFFPATFPSRFMTKWCETRRCCGWDGPGPRSSAPAFSTPPLTRERPLARRRFLFAFRAPAPACRMHYSAGSRMPLFFVDEIDTGRFCLLSNRCPLAYNRQQRPPAPLSRFSPPRSVPLTH